MYILLLNLDIFTRTASIQMSADKMIEVIRKDLVVRFDEARHALDFAQGLEEHPAGEDDVDEHEDLLYGSVDEDVAGFVVGTSVYELEGLVADFQSVRAFEGDGREWSVLWVRREG